MTIFYFNLTIIGQFAASTQLLTAVFPSHSTTTSIPSFSRYTSCSLTYTRARSSRVLVIRRIAVGKLGWRARLADANMQPFSFEFV